MGLLIRGKTVCKLCGDVIGGDAEVVAFPAFLKPSHRLARFSDAVFHRQCFEECRERREVEQLLEEVKAALAGGPTTLDEYEAWAKERIEEMQEKISGHAAAASPVRT